MSNYTSQYTGEQIDEAVGNVRESSDFVIENGTINGWNYRKWKSGVCEVWGLKNINPVGNTESGSGYFSDVMRVSTPFPIANAIVTGTAGNRYVLVNTDGSYTNQEISFRLWRSTAITTDQISVQIQINGYWIAS